jgi:serine protease AprX
MPMASSNRPANEGDGINSFDPGILDRSVIAIPLLEEIRKDEREIRAVIIDLNLDYPDGRDAARSWVLEAIGRATANVGVNRGEQEIRKRKTELSKQYVFARLDGRVIRELVRLDVEHANAESKLAAKTKSRRALTGKATRQKMQSKRVIEADTQSAHRFRAIYRIWPDFRISPCITKSVATVKADAAQTSFNALGTDIAWAIMDSGIDANHPHFVRHGNVDPASPLHADFTETPNVPKNANPALIDRFGHGTHVAGVVAGEQVADGTKERARTMRAVTRSVKGYEEGRASAVETHEMVLDSIRGMAPRCRLVSLKVLDDEGNGEVSNLIAAIAHIQEKNGHGRLNLIHGINISLGYEFDPEWFACGQSPLCVEINRLVRSGVVVVVAAGNTGYGALAAQQRTTTAGMEVTINDPGNADLAITVGSTHRDMPHVYGVSYFSSKGPTGDGRLKPDLVAPGEKILSSGTGKLLMEKAEGQKCEYVEDSGTSMAAPHVSGVIAAFLSVRREFIGEPERVKTIFLATATDLKRDRYFQGAGLVDLMRAIQSL